MDPNIRTIVAELAVKQHGNITRQQLLAVGVGQEAIKHWARAGYLHPVHRGVYGVGRPSRAPLERAAAAVLASGDSAALSHASAMANWGFWKRWESPFEVSATADRRRAGIVVHHSTTLHRRDVRTQQGIRTTSPARTLFDMATRLRDLTRAVNNALHTPYLTESQLRDVVMRHPRHPSSTLLRAFIAVTTGLTRSELEDVFAHFCANYGLSPLLNVVVNGYLVDAYFPEHRLIVELDSWQFHSTRIDFEKDRDRDADQLSADIATIRITYERMTQSPDAEAARLMRILEKRASRG